MLTHADLDQYYETRAAWLTRVRDWGASGYVSDDQLELYVQETGDEKPATPDDSAIVTHMEQCERCRR